MRPGELSGSRLDPSVRPACGFQASHERLSYFNLNFGHTLSITDGNVPSGSVSDPVAILANRRSHLKDTKRLCRKTRNAPPVVSGPCDPPQRTAPPRWSPARIEGSAWRPRINCISKDSA